MSHREEAVGITYVVDGVSFRSKNKGCSTRATPSKLENVTEE